MEMDVFRNNFLKKESYLSSYACKSSDAIYLKEEDADIRPAFFHDTDRIIHAHSYTRYLDKTQVFSFNSNDHIQKRIIHVQLVSKIARTIGRALDLNEDLIEAIALGHDIGHTPLGHFGESVLNDICQEELHESFAHNIQGVREYMFVENNGKGLNLSIQVLDGIMCHNGEMLSNRYVPMKKDKEEFLREYYLSYTDLEASKKYSPMTLEGCVVRISDIIGYIGRDIEDALTLKKIKRSDIPTQITDVLGTTNREIVNTIIVDIITHSLGKNYIEMSDEVYHALIDLKKFNYQYIYNKSMKKDVRKYYAYGIRKLYHQYLNDIHNSNSTIYAFIHKQSSFYQEETSDSRKVIDYIAGMTDDLLNFEISRMQ